MILSPVFNNLYGPSGFTSSIARSSTAVMSHYYLFVCLAAPSVVRMRGTLLWQPDSTRYMWLISSFF